MSKPSVAVRLMSVPEADRQLALDIEQEALKNHDDWLLYIRCMNDMPMSERISDQEIRDGCILTHHVYKFLKENQME